MFGNKGSCNMESDILTYELTGDQKKKNFGAHMQFTHLL